MALSDRPPQAANCTLDRAVRAVIRGDFYDGELCAEAIYAADVGDQATPGGGLRQWATVVSIDTQFCKPTDLARRCVGGFSFDYLVVLRQPGSLLGLIKWPFHANGYAAII